MATFTWVGVSGSFSAPHFWQIDGTATNAIPGTSDDALVSAAGTYVVSVGSVEIGSLAVSNPAVSISIQSTLAINGTLDTAGTIAVGQAGTSSFLRANFLSNSGMLAIAAGSAATVGQYNYLGGQEIGAYINNGVINIAAGGRLDIAAPVATSALGTIQSTGGTVALDGTVDNNGHVLSAAPFGTLAISGPLLGGTIDTTQGPVIITGHVVNGPPEQAFSAILDGVTVHGTLAPHYGILVRNGLALQPAIAGGQPVLDLAAGGLDFRNTQALTGLTINSAGTIGGQYDGLLQVDGTLGMSNVTWTGSGLVHVVGEGALVLPGTLTMTQPLLVTVSTFDNTGVLTASGTGTSITLAPIGVTLDIRNEGTIVADGGTVTASLDLGGTGVLALAAGGTVALLGAYGGQSFDFRDGPGTLMLSDVAGTSTVTGFTLGDTIDLVATPATIAYSNGTLDALIGSFPLAHFILPDAGANAQFAATTNGAGDTIITETVPCFAAGTRILTPAGHVAVENLRVGDRVVSAFGGTVAVSWIGRRRVHAARHPDPRSVWPVRLRAGALADGVPARDLRLSPEHAVHLDGVLVPAGLLVNGSSIVREPVGEITYFHVELPQHDLLLAEGAKCESYLDTGNRADFENAGAVVAAWPRFGGETADELWRTGACAPQCRAGPRLDAIRAAIDARAATPVRSDPPAARYRPRPAPARSAPR